MFDPSRYATATAHRHTISADTDPVTELPIAVVRGAQPGPLLVVTAGVHGSEFASIEAAYRLAATDPRTLHGTLAVLPILCPPSFFARSIYVNPIDGENLNRRFPGNANGRFSQRLAAWFDREFLAAADAYVDLHGGDLIEPLEPFTIFAASDDRARAMAEAFGIRYLIASEGTGMTFSAAAMRGVPAILPEAAGQGMRPEAEIVRLAHGVERVMVHLGMREGPLEPRASTLLGEFRWLRSEHRGLWYPAVSAGERVERGQALGTVRSLLEEILQEAVSPVEGVVLFGVSSLSINAGDPIVGLGA